MTTPTGMGAVYVRRSDGTSDTYYVTTDHLGSTDRILKAASGTVQVAESFAPFGARRGSDWQGAPSAADLTAIGNSTPDGFTGHEMLDGVGLIHMRGRVYDPTVGRFLSVDPLVRDAGASQSWNGYGYVEGRMLSARDPSGWSPEKMEEIVVSRTRDGGPSLGSNVNFGLDSYFRQLRAARAWTPASERQIGGSTGLNGPVAAPAEEPADEGSSEDVEEPQSPLPTPALPQMCFAPTAAGGSTGTFRYAQRTGQIDFISPSGETYFVGDGYAGVGEGLNNPSMQQKGFVGPIPQGNWTIGQPYRHPTLGRMTMNLLPAGGTTTFGRDLFRIHGDNSKANFSASQGCIVTGAGVRSAIGNSGATSLTVVGP